MCENPSVMSKTATQRLEHKLLIESQKQDGRLEVDDKNAYFRGKSIPKELWRQQAFQLGLPADTYLDIAALANNERGKHFVEYNSQKYLVEVNGTVPSPHGLKREIKSVTPYQR